MIPQEAIVGFQKGKRSRSRGTARFFPHKFGLVVPHALNLCAHKPGKLIQRDLNTMPRDGGISIRARSTSRALHCGAHTREDGNEADIKAAERFLTLLQGKLKRRDFTQIPEAEIRRRIGTYEAAIRQRQSRRGNLEAEVKSTDATMWPEDRQHQ